MPDRYVIEPVGESVLLGHINTAIAGLTHPKPLFVAIGGVVEQNVNLRIRTKTDPNGVPWPELSKLTPVLYYTLNKERRAGLKKDQDGELIIPAMPGTMLERSRRMLNSLASNASDSGLDYGFSVPYAAYHETGTKRNDQPYMPRRGMLMGDPVKGTLGDEDRQDVQVEIEAYLAGLFGG